MAVWPLQSNRYMTSTDLAFEPNHDHQRCMQKALDEAIALCKGRGLRFTAIRELVLKLIWQSHQPLGAYELLPALEQAGFNSAPPTVYRALDFLMEQGFIHRIASLNAYIGCSHPEHSCSNCFMICQQCKMAVELESEALKKLLRSEAEQRGFAIAQENLELVGTCSACQSN